MEFRLLQWNFCLSRDYWIYDPNLVGFFEIILFPLFHVFFIEKILFHLFHVFFFTISIFNNIVKVLICPLYIVDSSLQTGLLHK